MPTLKKFAFPDKMDGLSKFGSGILADAIMDFWARKGHPQVVAERFPVPDTASWGVRSNLVQGLPPARIRSGRHGG